MGRHPVACTFFVVRAVRGQRRLRPPRGTCCRCGLAIAASILLASCLHTTECTLFTLGCLLGRTNTLAHATTAGAHPALCAARRARLLTIPAVRARAFAAGARFRHRVERDLCWLSRERPARPAARVDSGRAGACRDDEIPVGGKDPADTAHVPLHRCTRLLRWP